MKLNSIPVDALLHRESRGEAKDRVPTDLQAQQVEEEKKSSLKVSAETWNSVCHIEL